MTDYKKGLGERIIYCRRNMNLSRAELSDAIGLSNSYLGLVERGARGISVHHLIQISLFFNVSISYLLSGTEEDYDKDDAFLKFMSQFEPDEKELITKVAILLIKNSESENQLYTLGKLIDYYLEYKSKVKLSNTAKI